MSDLETDAPIHGSCAPDFAAVRDAFERNFTRGDEVGAAVAVWVDGTLVVNLWGGWADAARTRAWQQDTLTTVLSGTKGLSATCVHQLADRGELDLQAPVARYWPEFGQAGKRDITLAMVMSHRSGVIGPAPGCAGRTSPTGTSSANSWPPPNPIGSRAPPRATT